MQIWSTESMRDIEGDVFSLDAEGGYICPAGSFLNQCGEIPVGAECVTRGEEACLTP